MIYAEKRREDGGDGTHYTDRYLVYNGDNLIGSYGVHYGRRGAYGASRDYHRVATQAQIEARAASDAFEKLSEEEQDAHYEAGTDPGYAQLVTQCCYLDDKPAVCDGSSLVEVTTDDKRAFEIAAMMADVDDRDVPIRPVHEHDCDNCTFIGSYSLRNPYTDHDGYRTGIVGKRVTMADVYLACDNSGYKYIIRKGRMGEYTTDNTVSRYVLAPLIDGIDPYAN
jgi:hypothetical protein